VWTVQVTSVASESATSAHDDTSAAASHQRIEGGDTDRPSLIGHSADAGDQSQLSAGVDSAVASSGALAAKDVEGTEECSETKDGVAVDEVRSDTGLTTTAMEMEGTVSQSNDEVSANDVGTKTDEEKLPNFEADDDRSPKQPVVVNDFLALSYLLHPPDGATFDQPYVDAFWRNRWSRMEPEIRRMLRKSSRLASDVITLGSSDSSSSGGDDEFESTDSEFSYDDSMSPVLVHERASTTHVAGGRTTHVTARSESTEEIVLDETSSTAAIVLGDDDDDDVRMDEIICSGDTNTGDKTADSSIVVCEPDNSMVDGDGSIGVGSDHPCGQSDNGQSSLADVQPIGSSDAVTDGKDEVSVLELASDCDALGSGDRSDKQPVIEALVSNGTC